MYFNKKHLIIIHRERKSKDPLEGFMKIFLIKNYGRSKSTFRKGAVGEWNKLFDNKISSYFYNNIPGDIKDIEFDN